MYVKYQSNIERHRNYLTTHRVDDSYSALYAAQEDQFIAIAEGKDQGNLTETIYRMDKKEKNLLENFLYVRNNGLNSRPFKIFLIAGKFIINQQLIYKIRIIQFYKKFNDYLKRISF